MPGLALTAALFFALSSGAFPGTDSAHPAARVEVVLPEPAALRYAGAGADRAALLADLGLALEQAVRPRLPAGSALRVAILSVDLAGRFEPWLHPQLAGVRIVRDVYSPSIELEFTFTDAAGAVRRDGRRTLRDPSGAILGTPDLPADPLRFEKLLLRNWVEREFSATNPR
jgi:hypothetical protein